MPMPLSQLQAALDALDAALPGDLQAPLYLIGSAAARLAGAPVDVNDLDLLTAVDDAARLERAWSARRVAGYAPADDERFRSRFARYAFPLMAVEVMGGLEVRAGGAWRKLRVERSAPLAGHAACLRLPSLEEQLRILALFDREKDRVRAGLLAGLRG